MAHPCLDGEIPTQFSHARTIGRDELEDTGLGRAGIVLSRAAVAAPPQRFQVIFRLHMPGPLGRPFHALEYWTKSDSHIAESFTHAFNPSVNLDVFTMAEIPMELDAWKNLESYS